MKKKNYSLIYLSIFLLIIIVIFCILFAMSYKGLKGDIKNNNTNTLYGIVLETGKNYIKVKDTKTDDVYYLKYTKDNITTNDIISIKYRDSLDNFDSIEVIVDESDKVYVEDTTTTTTKITTSIVSDPTSVKTTKTHTKENSTSIDNSDDIIVGSFKESYNLVDASNDKTISEKTKKAFIEIVDFIFYGTEINGRTFESLTISAKGKIIYYALLIDSKIDSKWPSYKENINDKYKDAKAKLIAKYLDLTTKACNSDQHACEIFKKDFNLLKSSLKLTWDVIKKAFSYAYDKTSSKLIEWYEVFSGKA